MMGFFFSKPFAILVLVAWGTTTAYQWRESYLEKNQWQEATKAYEEAYANQLEEYDLLNAVLSERSIAKRNNRDTVNEAINRVYKVSTMQETAKYASTPVPDEYIAVLRIAARGLATSSEKLLQQAPTSPADGLRPTAPGEVTQ